MKIRSLMTVGMILSLAVFLSSCNLIGLLFGEIGDPSPSPSPTPSGGDLTVSITVDTTDLYAGQPVAISANANSAYGNDNLQFQWHINGSQVPNAWMPYAYLQVYSTTSKGFELMVNVFEPDTNETKSAMVQMYVTANPYVHMTNNMSQSLTVANFGDIMDDGAGGWFTDWGGTNQLGGMSVPDGGEITIYNVPLNIRKKIRAGYFDSGSNQDVFFGLPPTSYDANIEYMSTGLGVDFTVDGANSSVYPLYSNDSIGGLDVVIGPFMDMPPAVQCQAETQGTSFTPGIDYGASDLDLDFDEPLTLTATVDPAAGNYSYQWLVGTDEVVGATMPSVYFQGRTSTDQWVDVSVRVTNNDSGEAKIETVQLYQRQGASLVLGNSSGSALTVLNMGERPSGDNLHFTQWNAANMMDAAGLPTGKTAVVLHMPTGIIFKMRTGPSQDVLYPRTDDYDPVYLDSIDPATRNFFSLIPGPGVSVPEPLSYGAGLDYTLAAADQAPLVLEYSAAAASFYVDVIPEYSSFLSDQPITIDAWTNAADNGLWDYQWYVNYEPVEMATAKYSYLKMRSSNFSTGVILGVSIADPATGETHYDQEGLTLLGGGSLEITNTTDYAIDQIYAMRWNTEADPDAIQTYSMIPGIAVSPGQTAYIYGLPTVYVGGTGNFDSYMEFQFINTGNTWTRDRTLPSVNEESDRVLAGRRLTYALAQWEPISSSYDYFDHSGDPEIVIGLVEDMPNSILY